MVDIKSTFTSNKWWTYLPVKHVLWGQVVGDIDVLSLLQHLLNGSIYNPAEPTVFSRFMQSNRQSEIFCHNDSEGVHLQCIHINKILTKVLNHLSINFICMYIIMNCFLFCLLNFILQMTTMNAFCAMNVAILSDTHSPCNCRRAMAACSFSACSHITCLVSILVPRTVTCLS